MMNGLANPNRMTQRYLPRYSRRNPNLGNVAMMDELARGTRGAGLMGVALGDRSPFAYLPRGKPGGMRGVALGDRSPFAYRPRGMQDVFFNPQDGGWYEIRDGVPVRVSGSPPRPGTTSGGTAPPTPGNQSQWLQLINTLGSGVLNILQQNQALKVQTAQAQGLIPGGTGAAAGGQGLTGAVGQITTWASNNPLLVVAIGAGLFLFLAPSPRSKR